MRNFGTWTRIASLILTLAGCWRIADTHEVFSPTNDEAFHIACGMQWWQDHEYLLEPQHPPLSRIAAAAGPYWAGARRVGSMDPRREGEAELTQIGFRHGLALARRGNLVFFLLLCGVVWWWARAAGGEGAAAVSVFCVVCLPPILGHAGLATTDLSLTATLPLAVYATITWWRNPSWRAAALAGVTVALMVGSKYSALLLYPAAITGMTVTGWRRGLRPPRSLRQWALAGTVVLALLFAFFQFRSRPMTAFAGPAPPQGSFAALIYRTDLPLTHFAAGIRQVMQHVEHGHGSYLMGDQREDGWWYFFPVVFLIKTPLAFLALMLAAAYAVARRWKEDAELAGPFLGALFLMLISLPSSINLGIRHILPMYPLLVVPVSTVSWRLLAGKRWQAAACAVLLAFLAGASIQAAPDYMADFNLLVGNHPEYYRVDSDLDWGQDLFRLADRCRDLKIQAINMAFFRPSEYELLGLPNTYYIKDGDDRHTSGWLAMEVTERVMRALTDREYDWLARYQPVERIGKTIELYRIDNPEYPDRAAAYDHPPAYDLAEFPARGPVAHISGALRGIVMGGEWRVWNQNGFEKGADNKGFLWLGHGNPGFMARVWSRRAVSATFRVEAANGPSRTDNVRNLELIVNGAAGALQNFEGRTVLTWPIELQAGINLVQLRTPDVRTLARLDNGDTRELLIGVDRIDIEPR